VAITSVSDFIAEVQAGNTPTAAVTALIVFAFGFVLAHLLGILSWLYRVGMYFARPFIDQHGEKVAYQRGQTDGTTEAESDRASGRPPANLTEIKARARDAEDEIEGLNHRGEQIEYRRGWQKGYLDVVRGQPRRAYRWFHYCFVHLFVSRSVYGPGGNRQREATSSERRQAAIGAAPLVCQEFAPKWESLVAREAIVYPVADTSRQRLGIPLL